MTTKQLIELRNEQKAKAYDEALERASKLRVQNPFDTVSQMMEYVFPELKESEGEKERDMWKEGNIIRHGGILALVVKGRIAMKSNGEVFTVQYPDEWVKASPNEIGYFYNNLEKQGKVVTIDIDKMVNDYANNNERGNEEFGKPVNCMIRAYRQGINDAISTLVLKKQGGQKPVDNITPFDKYEGLTDFERTLADICIGWTGEKHGWKQYIKDNADILLKIAIKKFNLLQEQETEKQSKKQGKSALEAIKEEKVDNTNKIEPKFHEGDWVVYNNDICQIVKREESCNKLVTVFGIEKELVNERNLSTARLWTIYDAKDGDILVMQKTDVTYESIFIFKKIKNNHIIQYLHYFTTDAGEEVCEARSIDGFIGFVESTVHPATKEQRATLFTKMKDAGWEFDFEKKELKSLSKQEVTKISNKGKDSNWSEDDERICQCIIEDQEESLDDVRNDKYGHDEIISDLKEMYRETIDWLKSLKHRISWKPSDEQIKALNDMNLTGNISYVGQGQTLIELYNDLKKLKEE